MEHTREFEPDTGWPAGAVGGGGARTLKQWLAAVAAVRPGSGLRDKMAVESAIHMIAATPAARRSQFAAEIQRRRRARSTQSPAYSGSIQGSKA